MSTGIGAVFIFSANGRSNRDRIKPLYDKKEALVMWKLLMTSNHLVKPKRSAKQEYEDIRYGKLDRRVSEGFSAFADELDSLKEIICSQQKQINELRKIVEMGR